MNHSKNEEFLKQKYIFTICLSNPRAQVKTFMAFSTSRGLYEYFKKLTKPSCSDIFWQINIVIISRPSKIHYQECNTSLKGNTHIILSPYLYFRKMSEVQSATPVKLINQLSLNSNGSSDVDSTEQQEDTEITLDQAIASAGDQADAWGFSRPNNSSQVSGYHPFKRIFTSLFNDKYL